MSKTKEEKEVDYVKNLRRNMDKRFSDLRKQMGPVRHTTEKRITENPLLAVSVASVVGIALGVGLGVALSKSRD